MKTLRANPAIKTIAVILALLCITGGFFASLYTVARWDDLWYGSSYHDSSGCRAAQYSRFDQVRQFLSLRQREEWSGGLTYLEEQRLAELSAYLQPENTNFRFRVVDNRTGEPVYGGLTGPELAEAVHEVRREQLILNEPSYQSADLSGWSSESGSVHTLVLELKSGEVLTFHSDKPEERETAARYGWIFSTENWDYDPAQDQAGHYANLAVEYGVVNPLTVQDEFWTGKAEYDQFAQYLPALAAAALVMDLGGVLLLVFLFQAAGWRRGREEPVRSGLDRVPLDLLAVLVAVAICIAIAVGGGVSYIPDDTGRFAGVVLVSLAIVGCVLAFLLSLATRIKTGTVFSNTLIALLCRGIAALCRAIGRGAASWPLFWKCVVFFLLYLLGTVLTGLTVFLIPVYQGLVLWALCRWTLQWKKVRAGAAEILGGNPDFKIDTSRMYPDLKDHAEQLNRLGSAISSAVDERLKSERFKTELITNVSHDLKTPLTSIINYVDLLKKEEISSPKAAEYIEVLDRKSQRLKKLTEDLVEASKASAGTLPVDREKLGMGQLVRQALGEYEEKFSQRRLELVTTLPDSELYVEADGRHLWRVLDNLLGNCHKYALEGTRIYLDLSRWEGRVTLTVKNISQKPLNVPPEQLMERFVRGDEARTTEGSGLGLSIARSLTELQGGVFRLDIDGDLFKASVSFPDASLN